MHISTRQLPETIKTMYIKIMKNLHIMTYEKRASLHAWLIKIVKTSLNAG